MFLGVITDLESPCRHPDEIHGISLSRGPDGLLRKGRFATCGRVQTLPKTHNFVSEFAALNSPSHISFVG